MSIFADDGDRARFLGLIEEVVLRFNWRCFAYCLMGNHYHLVVETLDGNLSLGMRHINGVYSQYFNRRHQRVGHVFQGRFKAILVERESYLLELCRYVVLNPVRAGVVGRVDDYLWSSYRATAGAGDGSAFLDAESILSRFDADRRRAQQAYRGFVMAGIGEVPVWEDLKSQCILGGEDFLARIKPALEDKSQLKEIPRCQRLISRPSLQELLASEACSGRERRNELMKKAHLEYGYSFAEIGRQVGLHYATVSRIVRKKMG
jgi:putative transposase